VLSVADIESTPVATVGEAAFLDPWSPDHPRHGMRLESRRRSERVRRYLNVAVAGLGLVVALPLMAVIALAIKLASPGPVIFTQVRVGVDRRALDQKSVNWRRRFDYGGRLFRLYKFRTMHHEADGQAEIWAKQGDPRVFRLGRFLRKYRLDELPQLVNVLKGDMNMVGPRPEQPGIFSDLREQIERYPDRQRILPGITGLAQVSRPYDACVADVRRKLSYDLLYMRRVSPLEDVRIMARTVPAVLLNKGGW